MASTPPTTTTTLPATAGRQTMADTALRRFFEAAVRFEASDLLLRGGHVPKLRLSGALKTLDTPAIKIDEFESCIRASVTDAQWEMYNVKGSLDLGVDFPMGDGSVHRFRINIFRTRGISAVAARRVNSAIQNFDELHLPKVMRSIAELSQGLVLICGVTGSGKSTTLAAMLQHINETRAAHIVTIEDPIEYLFTDAKATVNQREIGIDVPDFATALRALVRENPDVVLIGEMRDKETFEAAMQAAETGHLVFGTIHASSTSQAFGRIYDLFDPEERPPIRNLLAYQMQAFVYQKLLPTISGTPQRVPAVEVLLQSPPTRKFILEEREHELDQVVKAERQAGMQTFTDSLADLVERELVHPQVAAGNASNPQELKMRLRGIHTE